IQRCFPHIVNLSCKAVIDAVTNIDYAADDAEEFDPDISGHDVIASIRALVRGIRSSSLRRQLFSEILETLGQKDLQLLRDVSTRWSSTFLMIDRAITLREAIERFLASQRFRELEKYRLEDSDWDTLDLYRRVLEVPHAFQQKLSAEKTPTLSGAIPSFEAIIARWKALQNEIPVMRRLVQAGIDKLESYTERLQIDTVPAYTLAMCKLLDILVL
ncbi:hypothetical protein K435DRAFT_694760, partial [Dendrothele bispora CBS 962.96]